MGLFKKRKPTIDEDDFEDFTQADEFDADLPITSHKHHHYNRHWKLRFVIGGILLVLAFIGVFVTNFATHSAWIYWSFMVPVFAVACLILSWSRGVLHGERLLINLYKDILHWLGMFLAIKLIDHLISMALLNDVSAGLVMLALLALTTYLAGIYLDVTFFFLGIILGLLLIFAALLVKYLIFFMIPVVVITALIFMFVYKHRRDRFQIVPNEAVED